MLCGGVTVYAALRKCNALSGQWVAIMGKSPWANFYQVYVAADLMLPKP